MRTYSYLWEKVEVAFGGELVVWLCDSNDVRSVFAQDLLGLADERVMAKDAKDENVHRVRTNVPANERRRKKEEGEWCHSPIYHYLWIMKNMPLVV